MLQDNSSFKPASAAATGPAEALCLKGRQSLQARDLEQAALYFKQAVDCNPHYIPAFVYLASTLLTKGRFHLALLTYQHVLRLAPNDPDVLNGLGLCFQAEGNSGEAVAYFKKALQIRPNDVRYLYNLGLIKTLSPESAMARRLLKIYESGDSAAESRVFAGFALGKIYLQAKNPKRAFHYFAEANRLQYSQAGYDEAAHFANFEAIEGVFNADLLARMKNTECTSATPVFVLGMPRSGTTLVEQILASHSAVFGAGEINNMPLVAEKLIPELSGERFPEGLRRMDAKAISLLAKQTLENLRSYCPDDRPHIVSKNPLNFFLIGLISVIFPRATIIHCVRDPMDTCWSMFRHHFAGPYPYCYDQAALGRYYRRYEQLMRHWHTALPGFVYDLKYEQLVQEPAPTIRALLEHCRLPWEENCLAFHRTRRVVNTLSWQQVRQPIYHDSINSWKPFASELAPLKEALQQT